MVTNIVRHIVALLFWMGVVAVFVLVTGVILVANYLALAASFELLGFEARPLAQDRLVGWLFSSFASKATLADFYAMGLSLTVAGGLFVMFHLLFALAELQRDRMTYQIEASEAADADAKATATENAREAWRLMIWQCLILCAITIPLAVAINWDIDLFRYRSLAGLGNIDNPQTATKSIKPYEQAQEDHGGLFAYTILRWGPWGYLGVTALACLGFEFATRKTGETWARLAFEIEHGSQPEGRSAGEPEEWNAGAEPTTEPSSDEAATPDGDGADPLDLDLPPAHQVPRSSHARSSRAGDGASDQGASTGHPSERSPSAESSPPHDLPHGSLPGGRSGSFASRPAATPASNDLHDVIGGAAGERVTLAEALHTPAAYHVEEDAGEMRVWSRGCWNALNDRTRDDGPVAG